MTIFELNFMRPGGYFRGKPLHDTESTTPVLSGSARSGRTVPEGLFACVYTWVNSCHDPATSVPDKGALDDLREDWDPLPLLCIFLSLLTDHWLFVPVLSPAGS